MKLAQCHYLKNDIWPWQTTFKLTSLLTSPIKQQNTKENINIRLCLKLHVELHAYIGHVFLFRWSNSKVLYSCASDMSAVLQLLRQRQRFFLSSQMCATRITMNVCSGCLTSWTETCWGLLQIWSLNWAQSLKINSIIRSLHILKIAKRWGNNISLCELIINSKMLVAQQHLCTTHVFCLRVNHCRNPVLLK